jgi:hypothetical protein
VEYSIEIYSREQVFTIPFYFECMMLHTGLTISFH